MPPLIPGRYYSMLSTGSGGGTGSITGPRTVVVPFYIATSTNLDRISCRRTGATLVDAILGIYGPFTGTIVGCPLIAQTAPFTMSANGTYEQTINVTLAPGWYLLAVAYSATWNTETASSTTALGLLGRDAANGEGGYYHARWDSYLNPLPAALPASPTYGISSTPIVTIRAA